MKECFWPVCVVPVYIALSQPVFLLSSLSLYRGFLFWQVSIKSYAQSVFLVFAWPYRANGNDAMLGCWCKSPEIPHLEGSSEADGKFQNSKELQLFSF